MRVTVDFSAAANQGSGIGRYAREALAAFSHHCPEASLALVVAPTDGAPYLDDSLSGIAANRIDRTRLLPFSRRRADQLWFRARLPLVAEAFAGRSDLVYSPDFTAPPSLQRRRIVTVHDLAFRLAPETAPKPLRDYLELVVPGQVRKATRVAVVSEATRMAVQDAFGVSDERLVLVPNGVSPAFFSVQALSAEERTRLGLPESFVLTVGTIEPRKNHRLLLDAWMKGGARLGLPLVIVGRRGWADDDIVRRIHETQGTGRVVWLQGTDEQMLQRLYASAAAFVYPSWHEGFGLPVLEALAAGLPIVTSTATALVEVSHGHGQHVAADDVNGWIDAIGAALDPAQRHATLTSERIAYARSRTWDVAGRALAETARELCAL